MKVFLMVMQIIPALIAAMRAIEEAIPGQGKGEEKLTAIREIVEVSHEEAGVIWPILEKVIARLVAVFNRTGVFGKEGQ